MPTELIGKVIRRIEVRIAPMQAISYEYILIRRLVVRPM